MRLLLVCLIFVPVLGLQAADDVRERLLSRLPAETALCVELHAGGAAAREFLADPLGKRIAASRTFRQWKASGDAKKLQLLNGGMQQLTGMSLPKFAEGLFGRHVALAVFVRPDEEPRGLLLSEASSEQFLEDAIAAWKRAEPAEWKQIAYGDVVYLARDDGNAVVYVYRDGATFGLTDQEPLIRQVIDRRNRAGEASSLWTSEMFQTAVGSEPKDAVITAYLQPRAWDALLQPRRAKTPVERLIAQTWLATKWVMLSGRIDQGGMLEMTTGFDREALPRPFKSRLETGSTAIDQDLLRAIPADANFVIAGRTSFDLGPVLSGWEDRTREEIERFRRLGRGLLFGLDPLDDVLPTLGPSWVAWGRATVRDKQIDVDHATGVIQFRGKPNVEKALRFGIRTGMGVLSVGWNDDHPSRPVVLQESIVGTGNGQTEVLTLRSEEKYSPSVGVANDLLWMSTHPEQIAPSMAEPDPANNFPFARTHARHFEDAVLLVYAKPLADQLTGALVGWEDGRPRDRLVDAFVAAVHVNEGRVRLRLGLTTDASEQPGR